MKDDHRPLAIGALLVLVLVATAAARARMLDVPLERDEGEYAYAGRLLLEGVPPYRSLYTVKLPGTHVAYALLLALFGPTAAGLHVGLAVVNALCTCAVFALARRFVGPWGSLAAATTFALLSTHTSTLGYAGHATHFVVLFALAGLLLLPLSSSGGAVSPTRAVACGIALGLAVTMKQVGVLLFVYAIGSLLASGRAGRRPALLVAVGAALPLAALCTWLATTGVLDTFWFWTVEYGWQYATSGSLERAAPKLRAALLDVVLPAWPLWLLALLGLGRLGGDRRLAGFALCSALAVTPGAHFRPHYFIVLLPVVGILAGRALEGVRWKPAAITAFLAALAWTVASDLDVLSSSDPAAVSRRIYGRNPFHESERIGLELALRSDRGDLVAVLGSEPQIPFLAGLRAASGYAYVYPLMEPQPLARRMQAEMIRELEAAAPRFVVDVRVPWSWLERPGSERRLLEWRDDFLPRHYQVIGVIDLNEQGSVARWDEEARRAPPGAPAHLVVYERTR